MLLKIAAEFVAKANLMTREQFDSYTTETEREIAQAGIRKVFKKLFKGREGDGRLGRKDKKTASTKSRISNINDETTELDIHLPQYFEQRDVEIESFIKMIDRL